MKMEFAVIGAGRLGRTLGRLLMRRGYLPTGLSCRSLRSARQARAFIGAGEPTTSNVKAAARATLVLMATPDREIAAVARELARARLSWGGRIVAHTRGAVSSAAQIGRDTSELQSRSDLVCRLLLEKKKMRRQRDRR